MADLAIFVVLVALVAAAGILVGMLVAPRLGRLSEPKDEDEGGDTD